MVVIVFFNPMFIVHLSLRHQSLDSSKSYTHETQVRDKSFTEVIKESGNFKDWISTESQTKDSVHPQYNKKKVIPINKE